MDSWANNPRVNRCLKDKAMDRIDHALGRHVDPLGETYRDHFATGGALVEEMAASPNWEERGRSGDLRYFGVSLAGRQALAAHLNKIRDPYRSYIVSFGGFETAVAAISAAKAKYEYWLTIADCMGDITFGAFCRGARVRRAAHG